MLVFLFLVLFLQTGCEKEPSFVTEPPSSGIEESTSATDAEYSNTTSPVESDQKSYCLDYNYTSVATWDGSTRIVETDDSVYYLYKGMLYFSDREYKEFMPLCAKPDCNHKNDDCDANLNTEYNTIWLYDRYIYYIVQKHEILDTGEVTGISHASLWRMRLDGSHHEEVLKLPETAVDYTPLYSQWTFFFTGKYLMSTHTVCRELPAMSEKLMSDSQSIILTLDTMEIKPAETNGLGIVMSAEGALTYSYGPNPEDETLSGFYEFNFETAEMRYIGTAAGWVDIWDWGFGLCGNDFLYTTWNQNNNVLTVYAMNIQTGENRQLMSGSAYHVKWVSYDRITKSFFKSYQGFNDGPAEETRPNWGFYRCDLEGNVIEKTLYADLPESFYKERVILQTDNYIFAGHEEGDYYSLPTWYIDKKDFGTGNIEWKRWEP